MEKRRNSQNTRTQKRTLARAYKALLKARKYLDKIEPIGREERGENPAYLLMAESHVTNAMNSVLDYAQSEYGTSKETLSSYGN